MWESGDEDGRGFFYSHPLRNILDHPTPLHEISIRIVNKANGEIHPEPTFIGLLHFQHLSDDSLSLQGLLLKGQGSV